MALSKLMASVTVLKDRLVSGHQTMPAEDGYKHRVELLLALALSSLAL